MKIEMKEFVGNEPKVLEEGNVKKGLGNDKKTKYHSKSEQRRVEIQQQAKDKKQQ